VMARWYGNAGARPRRACGYFFKLERLPCAESHIREAFDL